MMLGRVVGTVVATVKHPALDGRKLLVIQPLGNDGTPKGKLLVAADAIGAGAGETIYWCRGREASLAFAGEATPVDAAIVGIVDTVRREGTR